MYRGLILILVTLSSLTVDRTGNAQIKPWSQVRRQFLLIHQKTAPVLVAGKPAARHAAAVKQRLQMVTLLKSQDHVAAARLLVRYVLGFSYESSPVRTAARQVLTNYQNPKVTQYLLANTTKGPWQVRVAILQVLYAKHHPGCANVLLQALQQPDMRVKTMAVDLLGQMKLQQAVPQLRKLLSSQCWQLQVAVMQALAAMRALETFPDLLTILQKGHGRLRLDAQQALERMTGKNFGDNYRAWESWYCLYQKKGACMLGNGPVEHRPSGTQARLSYYGMRILSQRLVFIIDCSGSMNTPLVLNQRVVVTGSSNAKPHIDQSRIHTKMDLAKAELCKAIAALPASTYFNIIFYAGDGSHSLKSGVRTWCPKLVRATPANKQKALQAVRACQANGCTNIYGALHQAFTLNTRKVINKVPRANAYAYRYGIDCIFFLTDGSPTDGPSPFDHCGAKICEAVKDWNAVRRIRINTIGIGDHDRDLLQTLARQSGGRYVAVGATH